MVRLRCYPRYRENEQMKTLGIFKIEVKTKQTKVVQERSSFSLLLGSIWNNSLYNCRNINTEMKITKFVL